MSKSFVLAHKRTVGSGAELAAVLGIAAIVPTHRPRGGFGEEPTIINYGVGSLPKYASELSVRGAEVLNPPAAVAAAVNKKVALHAISREVPTPVFTEKYEDAMRWFNEDHRVRAVFGRTKLTGSGGEGIVVFNNADEIFRYVRNADNPSVKLFTLGMPKNKEFRVHVVNGKVIDYAQKRRMGEEKLAELGLTEANRHIRNHDNGWVFCKSSAQIFPEIEDGAIRAVAALGLDFGAVDILAIVRDKRLIRYQVCEVNTAPSLSAPSTLEAYKQAFSEILEKDN